MKSNQLFLHQLPLFHQGKVRDTYTIPDSQSSLLVVATDRVSTHNIVHQSLIPGKGKYLTMLTAFFAEIFAEEGIESHVLAYGRAIYDFVPELKEIDQNGGDYFARSLVVERLSMFPIEFVFRSFLAGSLWKLYESGGSNPYGLDLVSGLQPMSRLEVCYGQPLFTPTANRRRTSVGGQADSPSGGGRNVGNGTAGAAGFPGGDYSVHNRGIPRYG